PQASFGVGLHRRLEGSAGVALRDGQGGQAHFLVYARVGGQQDGPAENVVRAVEVGDGAARFAHQQNPGRGVPGVQAKFPEAVKAAAGHAGQIKRGRAVTADSVRTEREVVVVVNVVARTPFMHGKTGAKQAGGKRSDLRHRERFAVECRAF